MLIHEGLVGEDDDKTSMLVQPDFVIMQDGHSSSVGGHSWFDTSAVGIIGDVWEDIVARAGIHA